MVSNDLLCLTQEQSDNCCRENCVWRGIRDSW